METRTTIPYECYKNYRNNFYSSSNLEKVLKECRDFVSGKQYTDSLIDGMPKPIFNITREYAVKSSAKITEIKPYITFITNQFIHYSPSLLFFGFSSTAISCFLVLFCMNKINIASITAPMHKKLSARLKIGKFGKKSR